MLPNDNVFTLLIVSTEWISSARIDEFWQHQEVLFNYKSKLSGTGNRSQIKI